MKENLKLLLIDDDEDDRHMFKESVRDVDQTIECVTASNSQQGLTYLRDNSHNLPDYIFLDLRMPGYSGRKCLEEIHANDQFRGIPVIIYTTSTDEQDASELRDMGAVHFISKPTDPTEIYYMISQVINEKWK